MPRYFFHIRQLGSWVRDEEGMDLPNLSAAIIEARHSARDFATQQIKEGKAVDGRELIVEDASGAIVYEFAVRDIRDEMEN
jgi:hypothetical protein